MCSRNSNGQEAHLMKSMENTNVSMFLVEGTMQHFSLRFKILSIIKIKSLFVILILFGLLSLIGVEYFNNVSSIFIINP